MCSCWTGSFSKKQLPMYVPDGIYPLSEIISSENKDERKSEKRRNNISIN